VGILSGREQDVHHDQARNVLMLNREREIERCVSSSASMSTQPDGHDTMTVHPLLPPYSRSLTPSMSLAQV